MVSIGKVDRLATSSGQLHDGDRLQPVYAFLPVRLITSLESFLASGERKIDRWYAQHKMARADFSDVANTFHNINTPQDQFRLQQEGVSR